MSGIDDPPGDATTDAPDPWAAPPFVEPTAPISLPETPETGSSEGSAAADRSRSAHAQGPPPFGSGLSAAPAAPDQAEGHGWPAPSDARPGNGDEPYLYAPPSAGQAPPPQRPERHSRNPVDRLTRGLPNPLRVTIDWVVTIVGAIAIVLLVKAYVVNPYRIPSSSMEPTLHCSQPAVGCETNSIGPVDLSDRVLANRFLYKIRDPRRGEIIVFETPPAARLKCGAGGTFVKRLIGLPGDTVEVRLRKGDGYVYINGKPLKEPYIETARRGAVGSFGPVKVKPDNYFMMGDNRSQSCDSRLWGTVPRENLIGKVFATYWPPKRISLH